MKAKQLLILLLTGTLSFTLVGCNEPLEDNTIENPVEPDNGGGDGGGDDGSGDGGDDGSGDGGDDGEPIEYVGTWENKDEDGDGVPDEQDVSPFNSELSQWTIYEDVEPNNSHISANNENNLLPFLAEGIISQKEDKDTFRFKVEEPTVISVVIHAKDTDFSPRAFILGKDNASLQAYTDISPSFGQLRFIASYQIRESGTYHLSLSDEHYRGKQSYTYDVSVFEDLNVNGVADFTEVALGMSKLNLSDKDNDGAKDAAEYYVYKYDRVFTHDIDNDGIPNWEDTDSDGDGILDEGEGIKDNDLDGFPSRFDLDSDSDGIFDETFVTNTRLKDSDFDGEPDYRDIDDDGDLVIDSHDQNPAEKIGTADLLSPDSMELVNLNYNYLNQYLIPDLVIENESGIIKYNGKQSSGWLVIQFDDHFINLAATVVNNQLKFDVPYAAKSVFFTDGIYKSNTLDISLSPKGTPIIIAEQAILAGNLAINSSLGKTLTIQGDYFYPDSLIVIGDKEYTPDSISFNELNLEVTTTISSGELKVKTSYGYSNSVEFELVSTKEITLASEFDAISSDIIVSSFTGVDYNFTNGKANINTSGYFYSGFFVKNKSGKNYPYYIYLEGLENDFSPLHLAISSVWFDLRPDQVLTEEDSLNYYHELASLDGVLELADYILTYANSVEIITEEYEMLLQTAINEAKKKYESIKNTNPRYTNYANTNLQTQKKNQIAFINQVIGLSTSTEAAPVGDPIISSDWNESDTVIEIDPSKEFNSLSEGRVYTGNLDVKNDTALMLSAEFSLMNSERLPVTPALIKHIDSYFHKDIVGPQGWGILNIANTQGFKQCEYKDCIIDIVTPGLADPQSSSPLDVKAQRILAARLAIEQILIPVLNKFIPNAKLFKDKAFRQELIKAAYGYVVLYFDVNNADTNYDKFKKVAIAIKDDLWNKGPIYQIISSKLAGNVIEQVSVNAAKWIGESFIPVYGQVRKVIDALSSLNTVNGLAQLGHDMFSVPGHIRYSVEWPVVIYGLSPILVDKDNTISDLEVSAYGRGFVTQDFWLGFGTEIPRLYITDTASNTEEEINLDESDINDEATEIEFKIPLEFVTKATEIKVHVIVEDIKATAPKNITFGSGLQISEVSPVATSIGDTITISGIGFSETNTQNKVIFTASSGRVSSLASSVVNGKLKVVVPEKAITGNIVVEVNGKESNELPLEVNDSGITVIFGDNGNLADDIFNIAIANKNSVEMDSTGQRSKEIFQQLDIGEYKISLTGEEVPDERGTYYVCFSDNVEVLNGPAQSAKELITGKGDTISWNIKVNSGDPKAVNSCIYNTSQLNNKRKVELLWEE